MEVAHAFLGIFTPEGLGPRVRAPSGEVRLRGKLGDRDCVEFRLRPATSGYPCGHAADSRQILVWSGTPARWGAGLAPDGPRHALGEALLERWSRLGPRAFDDLGGVLAAAVWDGEAGRLWCFRDKLGLVPIRYVETGSTLAFSNDPQWLVKWRGGSHRPDRWRLASFLARVPDTSREDFVGGVRRLRPREYAVWNRRLERRFGDHWQVEVPADSFDDIEAAAGQLRRRIEDVLISRQADQAAVAMSGGIDSAFIASQWSAVCRQRDEEARTASMVAPQMKRFDESADIARLERQLGLSGFRCDISRWWPLRNLELYERLVAFGPQPHPSSYHLTQFQRQVRRHFGAVTLIKGNGAELLLGGYIQIALHLLWRKRRLRDFAALGWALSPRSLLRIPCSELLERCLPAPLLTAASSILRRADLQSAAPIWLTPQYWMRSSAHPQGMARIPELSTRPAVNRRQGLLAYWGWEEFCRAAAVASRLSKSSYDFPYLDPRVWQLCLSVPETELIGSNGRKRLLEHAARGYIPRRVRTKTKEGFFDQIIQRGLGIEESAVVEGLMTDSHLAQLGLIEPHRFMEAYRAYQGAIAASQNEECVGSLPLWRTISAELWLRQV